MVQSMFSEAAPLTPQQAAEGAVRAYCGWHVAPVVTETLVRDGNGRSMLVLPTMRIVDVHSVRVGGVDVTGSVRWSEAGMLEGVCFPRRFRTVEVELEHGYSPDELPEVLGVVERAAKRFESDPRVRAQSVAGASVSYATGWAVTGGAVLSHLLTLDEKAALDPYRTVWGV